MRKFSLVTIVLLVLVSLLSADLSIRMKTHMDGFEMMGQKQPATDLDATNWLAKDRMVTHQQDKTFIVRMDEKKMYYVMHKNKVYTVIDLPVDLSKVLPPEAAQMMGMMKMSLAVTPTGNTKKIDTWNCSEYQVEMKMMMGTMNMTIWATTDIPFDFSTYNDMYSNVASMGFIENPEEYSKIKGYPIQTDMTINMMGMTIKGYTTVLEIKEATAPAGTYTPPADYQKKDQLSAQDFR